ncbi:hypothetical protein [Marinitoga sp. 38H-ov]|uniref:hypothetical protein n=1 Tax=Marinitoga sp. 38H-ov TaxID=1755814 RepID=UPI0013EDA9A7|nr:hypothetical protein [Marinitoga sp. 38H-ov]KAF2955395.1 hypothetical protein AS160_10540 [Marinitoga sp. 38H-ov]
MKKLVLSIILIFFIGKVFSHELKYFFKGVEPLNLKPLYTIATDKKYMFYDGSDISEEKNITIPEDIFSSQSMYWIISEDGNKLYIFENVYTIPIIEFSDLNENKAFVYIINLKNGEMEKRNIERFAPPPFPEGLAVRDIKEKNGKIYFLTNAGITIFDENFKIKDFYIFEDVANNIDNNYENGEIIIPYAHGDKMMIDKNEDIHVIDIIENNNPKIIYKKLSLIDKKENLFGYTIYRVKKEQEIDKELSNTNNLEAFLLNNNEIPYLLIFEENKNNQEYNLYKKIDRIALWEITEDGITEKNKIIDTRYAFRYEQIIPSAQIMDNNLYLLTTNPKIGYTNTGNLCFIKKYEINNMGLIEKKAKIFLNFEGKEPVQSYKIIPAKMKIRKINNMLYYYVYDKFYKRFIIFKEIE